LRLALVPVSNGLIANQKHENLTSLGTVVIGQ